MPNFSQGDVVRVPFPYTNRDAAQHRPALVVSDGALGTDGFLLWVLMITSAMGRPWPGDVPIDDLPLAGLPAPSVIRTMKLATIEAEYATRIGRIGAGGSQAVMRAMRGHLKL